MIWGICFCPHSLIQADHRTWTKIILNSPVEKERETRLNGSMDK